MTDHKVPGGHLVHRDGDLGEVSNIPTPAAFAAMVRDGRQGSAVSDLPFSDDEHHSMARDASGWDEETDQ